MTEKTRGGGGADVRHLTLYRIPDGYTYSPSSETGKALLGLRWLRAEAALDAWEAHIRERVAAGDAESVLWTSTSYQHNRAGIEVPGWLQINPRDVWGDRVHALTSAVRDPEAWGKSARMLWGAKDLKIERDQVGGMIVSCEPLLTLELRRTVKEQVEVAGQLVEAKADVWERVCHDHSDGRRSSFRAAPVAEVVSIADWSSGRLVAAGELHPGAERGASLTRGSPMTDDTREGGDAGVRERIILDLPHGSGPGRAAMAARLAYRFASAFFDRRRGQHHLVAYADCGHGCDALVWWTQSRAVSVRLIERDSGEESPGRST